jgi:hypothetical protein
MSDPNGSNTPKGVSFRKLEIPFDLDSIFTMQYNVQGLKSVLEFILEHLGEIKANSLASVEAVTK